MYIWCELRGLLHDISYAHSKQLTLHEANVYVMIVPGMLIWTACREEGMHMEKVGEVIEVKNGQLTVRFERPEACGECHACDGHKHQSTIQVAGDAQIGDSVTVSMPDGQVAKASFLAYAVPLLGMLLGLFIGGSFGGDVPALVGAAIGLVTSFLILRLVDGRLRGSARWTPKLVAVAKKQA